MFHMFLGSVTRIRLMLFIMKSSERRCSFLSKIKYNLMFFYSVPLSGKLVYAQLAFYLRSLGDTDTILATVKVEIFI